MEAPRDASRHWTIPGERRRTCGLLAIIPDPERRAGTDGIVTLRFVYRGTESHVAAPGGHRDRVTTAESRHDECGRRPLFRKP